MSKSYINEKARLYDEAYQKDNYFGCRPWLYRPYVRALVSQLRMEKGTTVLDAGCGQGVFTDLFAKEGMSVLGVDFSEVGIRKAKEKYPELSDRFLVFDLENPSDIPKVDCVFIRCCSLYNIQGFRDSASPTENLLGLLRPGGALIFAYSSNLTGKGTTWINHNLDDIEIHFKKSQLKFKIYLINKLDTFVIGRFSFNRFITFINKFACGLSRLSGDIIVIARKLE